MAVKLAVNQNTILKVYNELCRENILRIERGDGTYVSAGESTMTPDQRKAAVSDLLRPAIVQAVQLSVSLDEIKTLVDAEYESLVSRQIKG